MQVIFTLQSTLSYEPNLDLSYLISKFCHCNNNSQCSKKKIDYIMQNSKFPKTKNKPTKQNTTYQRSEGGKKSYLS